MSSPIITEAGVVWRGLMDSVLLALKQWDPPRLDRELDYHEHLAGFLRANAPSNFLVAKEYPHAGSNVDVYVRRRGSIITEEVFMELKLDLQDVPGYDRLVGQIERIDPAKHDVIVVLIGETDPRFAAQLRQRYIPPPRILWNPIMQALERRLALVLKPGKGT